MKKNRAAHYADKSKENKENMSLPKGNDNGSLNEPTQRKKKMNLALKIVLIVLGALLAIIIAIVSTITVMHYVGKGQIEDDSKKTGISTPDSAITDTTDDGATLTYNNEVYQKNNSVVTVLCMGIDKKNGLGADDGIVGTGGHADAVYLLALDTEKDKCTVVGISRDSLTDVNIYSTAGKYIGVNREQLCLSYAYGDGFASSCENTKKSVERLFYGLPIDLYYALDIQAISYINDEVGGVTVIPDEDFTLKSSGVTLSAGEPYTLFSKDAEDFVRYRDLLNLKSNNARMARQRQYISAFLKQTLTATKSDLSVPVDLYKDIVDYSVTDLTASKLTYLVTTMFSSGMPEIEIVNIKGTVGRLNGYAAYTVDDDALLKTIVDVFYKPNSLQNSTTAK